MAITDKVLSAEVTKKGYTVPYFLGGAIGLSQDESQITISYTGYPSAELSAPENSIWTDNFIVPSGQVEELKAAVIALRDSLIKARIDELNASVALPTE